VELLLNLVWLVISAAALLAWVSWRRASSSECAPQMLRGLMVVVCILVLLFPVISITDDLAESAVLAEGSKLQDVLKAPEHTIQFLVTVAPVQTASLTTKVALWRETPNTCASLKTLSGSSPNIEKRPPPQVL
jgi:hypothetical protein